MDNYEKYMNNPDIINKPIVLYGTYVIRLILQDKIKDLMPVKHTTFTCKET
jgi:hypothetical protein